MKTLMENDGEDESDFFNFYKKQYYLDYYGNKEAYATDGASFSTYAVVTPDGVWHEKGQMGWFGCSSESPDEAKKWDHTFYDTFIKNADPDLRITIVDCHI